MDHQSQSSGSPSLETIHEHAIVKKVMLRLQPMVLMPMKFPNTLPRPPTGWNTLWAKCSDAAKACTLSGDGPCPLQLGQGPIRLLLAMGTTTPGCSLTCRAHGIGVWLSAFGWNLLAHLVIHLPNCLGIAEEGRQCIATTSSFDVVQSANLVADTHDTRGEGAIEEELQT